MDSVPIKCMEIYEKMTQSLTPMAIQPPIQPPAYKTLVVTEIALGTAIEAVVKAARSETLRGEYCSAWQVKLLREAADHIERKIRESIERKIRESEEEREVKYEAKRGSA